MIFLLFFMIGEAASKTFEDVLLDLAILLLGTGTAGTGTMECSITILIISYLYLLMIQKNVCYLKLSKKLRGKLDYH